jgi:hypothetical protein
MESVTAIADELYGLPPAEFTRARDAAAAALRKEGRRAEAAQVEELRKPTSAAAAVNGLVRSHRPEVEQFLAAAAALRDAQLGGSGDLAGAARRERDALNRLVRVGGEAVRQTLTAAAVDEDAAAALLAGRLARELEPRGFGSLLGQAASASPSRPARKARPVQRRAARPDDRAARAQLRDAEDALAAARAEERRAETRLREAQRHVARAEAQVERARHRLDRLWQR